MIDAQLQPIQIPNQTYANEWIDLFRKGIPEFKDVARDTFVRLCGHRSWTELLEAARPNAPLFDFDQLPVDQRLSMAASMRTILSDEFGLRADIANHLVWTNPPGSNSLWQIYPAEFNPRRQQPDEPVEANVHAALDHLNRSRCLETTEGQARLNATAPSAPHLALLRFLQWEIESLPSTMTQIAQLQSVDQFYAEPAAFVVDKDLGRVPVFVAGFTATPGAAHDSVMLHYLSSALATAELLAGAGAPALVLYERSTSRRHKGHHLTCFGAVVYDDTVKDLLLNQSCQRLSDVFVNLVATSIDSPQIADFADNQLALQCMFERARQKHLFPDGTNAKLYRVEGASGWSEMVLRADNE
ncbi:hypothetical protein L4P27_006059 [Pseudomonas aeruginosa]|nr:hypothetical protein [Pseudomonas aeruginosa]EKV3012233.1 hypothetical protein [Pseudomonas aeruginosa]